jgi:hypothetical protein
MEPKMNVVLVHGAWVDGSSWSKVIPLLQNKGFNVRAPIGYTRFVLLAPAKGPITKDHSPRDKRRSIFAAGSNNL